MENHHSDPGRIKVESTYLQRDTAAKGGPATGLGNAQNRQVPTPADDDTQTRLAAQSADNDSDKKPVKENKISKEADEAQSDGDLSFPEGK